MEISTTFPIDQVRHEDLDGHPAPFNVRFRDTLKTYATGNALQFIQDRAGNIYITKPGRDSTLASIALEFPLDGPVDLSEGRTSFTSAMRVFELLRDDDLLCGVALVGWTSIQNRLVGRDAWTSAGSKAKGASATTAAPQIEDMIDFDDPANFNFSAILNILDNASERVELFGSPVLVAHAKKHTSSAVVGLNMDTVRAPELRIMGKGAGHVAHSLVRDYSKYFGALFDNLD